MPAGFEHRASSISRLIGDLLATTPPPRNYRLDHLSLPDIQINPAASDAQVAKAVVGGILGSLGSGDTRGSKGAPK